MSHRLRRFVVALMLAGGMSTLMLGTSLAAGYGPSSPQYIPCQTTKIVDLMHGSSSVGGQTVTASLLAVEDVYSDQICGYKAEAHVTAGISGTLTATAQDFCASSGPGCAYASSASTSVTRGNGASVDSPEIAPTYPGFQAMATFGGATVYSGCFGC